MSLDIYIYHGLHEDYLTSLVNFVVGGYYIHTSMGGVYITWFLLPESDWSAAGSLNKKITPTVEH